MQVTTDRWKVRVLKSGYIEFTWLESPATPPLQLC